MLSILCIDDNINIDEHPTLNNLNYTKCINYFIQISSVNLFISASNIQNIL